MAVLSSISRRKLRYLPAGGNAVLNPQALACWNWALTGFGPNPINPDTAFSYVSGYLNAVDLDPAFQQGDRLNRLTAVRQGWVQYQTAQATSNASNAAFLAAVDVIVKVSIEANGLSWSAGLTPYQLCMYYDSAGTDPIDGFIKGPNYTHWWLKIDGGGANNDGIESFPGSTSVTIRRPEYSNHHVYRVYLTALHTAHVQVINAALQHLIAANHNIAVPHGVWAADHTRNTCSICNENFGIINRKHHCRCCGRLVCSSCSPATRQVIGGRAHPNGRDGNGPQRVCLYCE